MITKDMENEIYNFLVDSNLEFSIVSQCENPKTQKKLAEWLQIGEVLE